MTIQVLDNADRMLANWASAGQKPTASYNRKYGTKMIHDSCIFDIITNASVTAKLAVLTSEAYHEMYDELGITKRASKEKQASGFNTYQALITYVLNMTEQKFGPQSVQKNTKYSFRGFNSKPEVIDYARMVCKVTLDRFEFRRRQASLLNVA
tara:strand:- start:196 stop:654 length:459 start_codon:yes stop_codon:yes gene_type:complete